MHEDPLTHFRMCTRGLGPVQAFAGMQMLTVPFFLPLPFNLASQTLARAHFGFFHLAWKNGPVDLPSQTGIPPKWLPPQSGPVFPRKTADTLSALAGSSS